MTVIVHQIARPIGDDQTVWSKCGRVVQFNGKAAGKSGRLVRNCKRCERSKAARTGGSIPVSAVEKRGGLSGSRVQPIDCECGAKLKVIGGGDLFKCGRCGGEFRISSTGEVTTWARK